MKLCRILLVVSVVLGTTLASTFAEEQPVSQYLNRLDVLAFHLPDETGSLVAEPVTLGEWLALAPVTKLNDLIASGRESPDDILAHDLATCYGAAYY